MMLHRRSLLSLPALLAILLAASAVAWACTAVPSVSAGFRAGPAGVHVPLDGTGFGRGEVEVRWNSPDGPLVGGASGPDFSSTYQVPQDATPGVYYIVAIQRNANGLVAKASDTYEVTSNAGLPNAGSQASGSVSGSRPAASDLWLGFAERAPAASVAEMPAAEGLRAETVFGAAFLALGALSLLAGTGVALRGRRRTTSEAGK